MSTGINLNYPPEGYLYDKDTGVLTITSPVTTVPQDAFRGDTAFPITKLIIDEGITSIENSAFESCLELTGSISLPSTLKTIGNRAFYCAAATENLVIPDSVTSIGTDAFIGMKITGIKYPGSITTIPYRSLYCCTNIKDIRLHEGITTISNEAFCGCEALTNIVIPSTVTSIRTNVFTGCKKLTDIYYNGTRSEWNNISKESADIESSVTIHCTDDADTAYNTWMYDEFNEASAEMPGNSGDDPETPTTDPVNDPLAISQAMLELLVTQILTQVNTRISGRIVDTITEASDNNHVPSALAVFNFLKTVKPGMSCQTVIGSMDSVEDPDSQIIYLQKDDEDDQTWAMYLWVDGAWVCIGDTSIDLVNYWSKSDDDIAELREKIFEGTGLVDAESGELDLSNFLKNDEPSKAIVLEWVGAAVEFTEEKMTEIVESVMTETDKVYVRKDELKEQVAATLNVITEEQIMAAVAAASAATDPAI